MNNLTSHLNLCLPIITAVYFENKNKGNSDNGQSLPSIAFAIAKGQWLTVARVAKAQASLLISGNDCPALQWYPRRLNTRQRQQWQSLSLLPLL